MVSKVTEKEIAADTKKRHQLVIWNQLNSKWLFVAPVIICTSQEL